MNCKDGKDYQRVMLRHFENAFLFSMNDEVVHTGFETDMDYIFYSVVGQLTLFSGEAGPQMCTSRSSPYSGWKKPSPCM